MFGGIRAKLLGYFVLISLIPSVIIGAGALIKSRNALSEQAFKQLESVAEIKKLQIEDFFWQQQIKMRSLLDTVAVLEQNAFQKLQSVQENKKSEVESYFRERFSNINVLSESGLVSEAVRQYGEAVRDDGGKAGEAWLAVDEQLGTDLKLYAGKQEYFDLILFSTDGEVVYSATGHATVGDKPAEKEEEAGAPLARAFKKGLQNVALEDFSAYTSHTSAEKRQIAFLSAPVYPPDMLFGEPVGVLALALTPEALNQIVQKRAGMGRSGESFLVGKVQDKTTYRSDRIIKGAGRNIIGHEVSGKEINKALAGESGTEIKATGKGPLELTAYAPLNIIGLNWGIISSIELEELITPRLKNEEDDLFGKYTRWNGYEDLYLIHPEGRVFYTVARHADYNSNILEGGYADTHLGQLVRKVMESQSFASSDYAPYPPNNNAPAVFIAQPMVKNDEVKLIVALQISADAMNTVMQQRAGMGESGETYLVGKDKLMRSNSFLAPDTHSIKASFANPQDGMVDTPSSQAALNGESGKHISENYTGDSVLSVYSPLQAGDGYWALLAEIHKTEALHAVTALEWLLGLIFAVVGIVALLVIAGVAGRLALPLTALNSHLRSLSRGHVTDDDIRYRGKDEIAEIIVSFKQLKNNIKATISQANAIASGDYGRQVELLSKDDALGHALKEMTRKLSTAVHENQKAMARLEEESEKTRKALHQLEQENIIKAHQDWLKSGQTQLNEKVSGEQNLTTLGENIITFLASYLGAQVGTFYLLNEDETQGDFLELIASYCYVRRKELSATFAVGEGVVGQAARERKMILIERVPEDYICVQSSLGEAAPRNLAVVPFLYENRLKGVFELGMFEPFRDKHLEFIEQVVPQLGVAVNTAQSREITKKLLVQSNLQKEQLQNQTAKLQNQTEELQSQAEELRSQQEELRQSNDLLVERGKDLEKQSDYIQEKNRALEQAGKTLKEKAQALELASRYKSEFLANMSHELRTPLNSLLILSELLSRNKDGNLSEQQVKCAHTIHSAGSDLLALINDILDLSKVEAGKIELHLESVELKELTQSLEQKFRHMAENKNIGFTINIAPTLPVTLYTDSLRLKQILTNLLSNAFKFTTKGEVHLDIGRPPPDGTPAHMNPAETLLFCVKDSGIGIPADKQEAVFKAFQQADGSTSRRYGGTGLGLSITRQLVQLFGGEIRLLSKQDEGSTFSVYLPENINVHEIKNVPPTKTPEQNISAPGMPRETPVSPAEESQVEGPVTDDRDKLQATDKVLLVVEDDYAFLELLMEMARNKGFKCLAATNGKNGLALAEKYKPGAIILDAGLPLLDGWSVMEKLKDNPETRHIPVHFISGADEDTKARKMGAVGYLLKPVDAGQLDNAFQRMEHFIRGEIKNLLLVMEDEQRRQTVLELVANNDVKAHTAKSKDDALKCLGTQSFDCMVVDIDLPGGGLQVLKALCQNDDVPVMPIILYSERDLTREEELAISRCDDHRLAVAPVRSPERLLDEATLFLHQVESELPLKKQRILQKMHDKELIFRDKKVLLVDDDTRNAFALVIVLEEKGMEVIIANNGKEALEILAREPAIDVVLMDIMMPEMDGYEATRRIREQQQFNKLPVIALTAKAMKGDKAKCIEAGANDYLTKPIKTDKLLSLMRVWLHP